MTSGLFLHPLGALGVEGPGRGVAPLSQARPAQATLPWYTLFLRPPRVIHGCQT